MAKANKETKYTTIIFEREPGNKKHGEPWYGCFKQKSFSMIGFHQYFNTIYEVTAASPVKLLEKMIKKVDDIVSEWQKVKARLISWKEQLEAGRKKK